MAGKPISLVIRPRGKQIKNLPETTYATPEDTCDQLYQRIAAKARFDVNRLRITKGSDGSAVPNSAANTVDEIGLYEASTIMVKDLGPQIDWRTVFIVEYLGPLLLHPLIYALRPALYKNPHGSGAAFPAPSASQTLSLALIVLHFLKREFETLYVHRFSNATMPALNIFKNSAHYWLLAGLNIALFTYAPGPGVPTARAPPYAWMPALAVALFAVGELGNLSVHLTLRGLRTAGGKERGVPNSWAFRLVPVTCPNYFFETLAWAGMWMANRSWSTGLFVAVAVGQMAIWARKKEARYRKEFGGKYKKKRFAMLPGIV